MKTWMTSQSKNRKRDQRGFGMAETAASLSIMLPLVVTLIFVILEVSYAFMLESTLSEASRQAARDLAIAYGVNPLVATSRSLQNSMVFDSIRINNVLKNSQQFDTPVFQTTTDPATVSVQVRYLSNQYGLPAFPNPDPLHLGSKYQVVASSTCRLE